MREHVLAMLKESDDFVSGQELCGKLSVSRTAIWKAINSLKEAGYVIEAVRNRATGLFPVLMFCYLMRYKAGLRQNGLEERYHILM